MKTFARNWWPIPVMFASVIAAQIVWSNRTDRAGGHAATHFTSASVVFGIAFFVAVLIWAAPTNVRHRVELWLLAAALLTAATFDTIGNLRVVDAIGTNTWSDAQAGALGPLQPGFTSGHDLAEHAAWFTVIAAVLLAAWLWRRHAVSAGVAVGAIIVSVIFPYWIFPGAGLVVLVIASVVARARLITS